jgi:pimeloyl-ACP methyl ester carboxylesterase
MSTIEGFREQRRALFAAYGFDGKPVQLADSAGRESYALARTNGSTPTVLVYGGVGDGAEWAQLAASIDGSVVIPDRPGFGLGYPVTFTAGNVRRVAGEWLTGIADGLRVEKINVVGCSMGGLFATAFALDHPDRIEHLVLAGSPASLVERMETFLRLWTAPGIGALITRAARFSDVEQVRSRIYRNYVSHPEAVPHDVLELTLAALQLPGKSAANRALLQAVMTVKGVRPELRFRDAMTRLEIPTLFAWGDSDRLEPASTGMALAGEMPAATFVKIEDAGHIPHIDQPTAVTAAINGFLHQRGTGSPERASVIPLPT